MLVIVEYRNTAALTQLALDDKTFGRLDIFEIDAAERGFEARDDIYELFGVAFVDLDIEDVDAREFLEENSLAFHHRLGRERTDISQAEHRGAIGDDADEIAARCHVARFGGIPDDELARDRHPRRVRKREIALVQQAFGGGYRIFFRAWAAGGNRARFCGTGPWKSFG